jgi:serine protease Do
MILFCALGASLVFYVAPRLGGLSFSNGQSALWAPRSYIGVNFGDDEAVGALVDGIAVRGGPADVAGLIGGDLITEVDGQPIEGQRDMNRLLASKPPGNQLKIKYLRDGKSMETVLVTAREGDLPNQPTNEMRGFLGVRPEALKRLRVPGRDIWGVRLGRIVTNRPADVAGIQQNDIVIEFGGHPIRTPRELLRRISEAEPYSTVEVKVVRHAKELIIPVKMGRKD